MPIPARKFPATNTGYASIWNTKRLYATPSEPTLKEVVTRIIPEKRELLKKVKAASNKKLGDVKVENALGGMRYIHGCWLVKEKGLTYRVGVSNAWSGKVRS